MDDLDHSISIVEYEWTSFYDECEECCLLLPSKADADNSSLSDPEESWSQERSEQRDGLQSPAAWTRPEVACLAVEHGPCFAEFSQVNQKHTDGEAEDSQTAVWEEKGSLHTRLNLVATPQGSEEDDLSTSEVQQQNEEIMKMVNSIATNETPFVQPSDPNDTQRSCDHGAHGTSSDLQRDLQSDTAGATTPQEAQPLSRHVAHRDTNHRLTQNAEKTPCGKDRSFLILKEKERWFVTVNVSPLRRKRRKKKKASRTFPPSGALQKTTPERRSEVEISPSEVESGNDSGPCETSQQPGAPVTESVDGIQTPAPPDTKPIHQDSALWDSELCSLQGSTLETPTVSKLAFTGQDTTVLDGVKSEHFENGRGLCLANIFNSRQQTAMLPKAVICESESRLQCCQSFDSIESMEFKSAEDFSSNNVSDCESYASAPETPEDPWPIPKDHRSENKPPEQRPHRRSLLLSTPCDLLALSETENVPHTNDVQFPDQTLHVHSAQHVSHDIGSLQDPMPLQSHGGRTEATGECTEAHTEPALPCLPVGQSDSLMLENHSANETLQLPWQPSDSKPVGLCSVTTDQPPAGCDPTACSVPDSPETYAQSLGPGRPVFAMSAFWDEMEKLTIRDILQLRDSGGRPSRKVLNIQDTAGPRDDDGDQQTDSGPQSHTGGGLWSETPLVDPPDVADSDYFTNPDDSQPDRSSCDVSMFSDLDEESCRDPSAGDPLDRDLHTQSPAASPPTRGPTEDTAPANGGPREEGGWDDPRSPRGSSAPQTAHVSRIQKSKSLHDIQTLRSPPRAPPCRPVPEDGEETPPRVKDLPLQGIPVITVNQVLVDGTLSAILSNPDILDEDCRIPFPEVLGYFYGENETEDDFVSNYDNQPLTSLCDDAPSSRYGSRDGLLAVPAPQWREEKPIPIFSCSGHALRELTFPEADFLLRPTEIHVAPDGESHVLPGRGAPQAPCPGLYPVPSSAAVDQALFNNRCWSSCWNSWFFIRNIRLHDHGSSWGRRSGPWGSPVGALWTPFRGANAALTLTPQRGVASFPHRLVRQLAADGQMLKFMPASVTLSGADGLFSTLKQADMCLLCIAVASWVLRSTDTHSADSWKAALLANVSAISAIQYLRRYVLSDRTTTHNSPASSYTTHNSPASSYTTHNSPGSSYTTQPPCSRTAPGADPLPGSG